MSAQSTGLPAARVAATVFSLVAALVYFAIALGFMPDGFKSPPAPVMAVAGLAYLIGGILILRVGRTLLALGAVLNVLVMLAFGVSALVGNATIDQFSIIGKIAQFSLEILLLWLLMSPRMAPVKTA